MGKVIGYTRVSTNTQTNYNQAQEIRKYVEKNKLELTDIIEVVVSSRKKRDKREIDKVLELLKEEDTLIVYALDRLGRSTIETLQIIEDIKSKKVTLILIKDNIIVDPKNLNPLNTMFLTMLSGFAELERNFISERTKAGLQARKAKGITLGRKKGSVGKSKFDIHRAKIEELYKLGVPVPIICKKIKVGTKSSLYTYIKKRNITKEES